jgi:Sec-independent protein translocase protein TatA
MLPYAMMLEYYLLIVVVVVVVVVGSFKLMTTITVSKWISTIDNNKSGAVLFSQ